MAIARTKPDATLTAAVDAARAALLEQVPAADVGEHLGHVVEGDRLMTHLFACLRGGYRGWRWSVTVTRASRQKGVTIDEVVLIPGDEAIVAPVWLPYKERIQPGDLSPGDLLPVEADDPRLVPAYVVGDESIDSTEDDGDLRKVADELGLGRELVLSLEGRELAAERWYEGDAGPEAPIAQSAPGSCTTCGFLVRLAGPLSELFGVCANAFANDDGRVVSFEHGCGAHSGAQLAKRSQPLPLPAPVFDTISRDDLEVF